MNRFLQPPIKLLLRGMGYLPLGLMRAVGSWVGRYSYRRRTRMAKITRRNLDACFPPLSLAERRRLEMASLRHTGSLAAETLVVWTRSYAWLRKRIFRVEGLDLVERELATGKGLIILGPHLGNWEVLGLYITELGPVTSLYQPPKRSEVEDLVRLARQRSGATLVPTDKRGITALLKSLRSGQVSGILPDQSPGDTGGRFSEFFGQPTYTMTLIYKLIQRTGSRVVFGYAKRVRGGFEIIFKQPPADIYSSDEAQSIRALNEGVERCVNAVPEQYQWEYKRFKRQAVQGDDFYRHLQ